MMHSTAEAQTAKLMAWYPKHYPESMSQAKAKNVCEDIYESFKKFPDEDVLEAYLEWHLTHNQPPTVADIRQALKQQAASQSGERKERAFRWVYSEGHLMAQFIDEIKDRNRPYITVLVDGVRAIKFTDEKETKREQGIDL